MIDRWFLLAGSNGERAPAERYDQVHKNPRWLFGRERGDWKPFGSVPCLSFKGRGQELPGVVDA